MAILVIVVTSAAFLFIGPFLLTHLLYIRRMSCMSCIHKSHIQVALHFDTTDIYCIIIVTGHGSCKFPGRYDLKLMLDVVLFSFLYVPVFLFSFA